MFTLWQQPSGKIIVYNSPFGQQQRPRRSKCLTPFICFLLLLLPIQFVAGGCRETAGHQRHTDNKTNNNNNNNNNNRACEAICSVSANGTETDCTIRALALLPGDDTYVASLGRVLPILKVAVDRIHDAQLLPNYINFEWMPHDDKCDASYAVIEAMDGIVKNCAHVIFGPVCEYPLASVGRIAKYMNSDGTPLISVGGATYDFEMKKTNCSDEFYMLVRTGTISFETISEMTIAVLKRQNWSHAIFFYERDGQMSVAGSHTCFLMMSSLGKQMRKENLTFSQYPLNTQFTNRSEEVRREIGNKHAKSPVDIFENAGAFLKKLLLLALTKTTLTVC